MSIASSSDAQSMMKKPRSCSLVSANGPSITSGGSRSLRSVVAAVVGISRATGPSLPALVSRSCTTRELRHDRVVLLLGPGADDVFGMVAEEGVEHVDAPMGDFSRTNEPAMIPTMIAKLWEAGRWNRPTRPHIRGIARPMSAPTSIFTSMAPKVRPGRSPSRVAQNASNTKLGVLRARVAPCRASAMVSARRRAPASSGGPARRTFTSSMARSSSSVCAARFLQLGNQLPRPNADRARLRAECPGRPHCRNLPRSN